MYMIKLIILFLILILILFLALIYKSRTESFCNCNSARTYAKEQTSNKFDNDVYTYVTCGCGQLYNVNGCHRHSNIDTCPPKLLAVNNQEIDTYTNAQEQRFEYIFQESKLGVQVPNE